MSGLFQFSDIRFVNTTEMFSGGSIQSYIGMGAVLKKKNKQKTTVGSKM